MPELEELAKVEGIDEAVKTRFTTWLEGKKFEERLQGVMQKAKSAEEVGESFLALYKEGVRPPGDSQASLMYWYYCSLGAVNAQDKEAALACYGEFEELAEGDERLGEMVADLKKQVEDIE